MNRLLLPIFLLISTYVFAQTQGSISLKLSPIALIDIEPSGNLNLPFTAPIEAGNPINTPTFNNSKWINYTSAIRLNGPLRRVTVAVNETIPGVNIKIQALPAVPTGAGTKGITTNAINVSTLPQTIIYGIGGAYTGDGINNGHQLNIYMEIYKYTDLKVTPNKSIVFTYTILE